MVFYRGVLTIILYTMFTVVHGVATVNRIVKILGLFCRILSLL